MTKGSRARRAWCAGFVVSVGCAVAPAAAMPLPAPFVSGEAGFNFEATRQRLSDFGVLEHVVPTHGTLRFSAAGTPAPALTATADLNPVGTGFGTVSGFLRYTFEILGPDCIGSGGCVAVDAFAAGHVAGFVESGLNAFESIARWSLRDTSEFTLVGNSLQISSSGGSRQDQAFAETHSLLLRTNTEYRVVMEVLARAGGLEPGALSEAEAFVDPLFRFGAGVDPALYAFHFADGIGNEPSAAVPAPGTSVLVMLGLLALAAPRRRRPSSAGAPPRPALAQVPPHIGAGRRDADRVEVSR